MDNAIVISFAPELVDLVKSGQKTKTYRLGGKYDFLCVGDTIETKNSATGEIFGELKIVDKSHTTFEKLPVNDADHETYDTKEAQRKIFEMYYGRPVTDNERVLILTFEVVHLK